MYTLSLFLLALFSRYPMLAPSLLEIEVSENAGDVENCFDAMESNFVVTTDTQSIRGAGMGVYDLDEFDSVTSTDVISQICPKSPRIR